MNKKITVLPGDGIGPEVVKQALKVLDAIADKYGHQFEKTYGDIGAASIDKFGIALTEETIAKCLSSDAVLLGAIGDLKYDNDPSATVRPEQGLLGLRKSLKLFSNFRPVKVYQKFKHLSPLKAEVLKDVDILICRELTGGIYFGEKVKEEDTASDLCIYTRAEIERIARIAFNKARVRKKKVTLVDKANVLESSRLWRRVVKELATAYPDVELDFLFIDNAAMQMILNPSAFDVVLTSNMFGDILSDEASVLVGSLGLLPSSSIGTESKLYEPVHGSYPQAAGQNIANPFGTILSVAMMLDDFKLYAEAQEIRDAVFHCIDNHLVTRDLDPNNNYTTTRIGDFVSLIIQEGAEISLSKILKTEAIII